MIKELNECSFVLNDIKNKTLQLYNIINRIQKNKTDDLLINNTTLKLKKTYEYYLDMNINLSKQTAYLNSLYKNYTNKNQYKDKNTRDKK